MGIQINGQTDTISATDGSFTISGASGNLTGNLTGNVTGNLTGNVTSSGISTFSDTVNVGAGKSIRLYGATSGFTEIVAAAGSASTTFTLPANGGSASQYLQTDGSGGLSWQTLPAAGIDSVWTSLGSTTTTGASTFTVTGIPTAAKHIKIIIDGFSSSNSSGPQFGLRLGNGSIDSGAGGSNYKWVTSDYSATESSASSDSIRLVRSGYNDAANKYNGAIDIYKAGTNVVVAWLIGEANNAGGSSHGSAVWSGSSSIDRVQLLVPTAHNADDGYFSVFYETQP